MLVVLLTVGDCIEDAAFAVATVYGVDTVFGVDPIYGVNTAFGDATVFGVDTGGGAASGIDEDDTRLVTRFSKTFLLMPATEL